ncbi:hypothetical protein OOT46_02100 [Aquabacterium sp. A7-Y]|uniref:hypothetical protein n=1 Tax=Aquabacterium sp. A7-Y TaxID=1349605 RepID=UPI00223E52BD|nr:hypothetical protein [Aquabacterium sp. A7-Y]MCW7536649.1 hypothetical protein [Aquabacterium sp. A7-Y]
MMIAPARAFRLLKVGRWHEKSNFLFFSGLACGTFPRMSLQIDAAAVWECRSTRDPRVGRQGNAVAHRTVFLLRSLPARLVEILERFSSSSLPPSFAPGRFAAFFFVPGRATAPGLPG